MIYKNAYPECKNLEQMISSEHSYQLSENDYNRLVKNQCFKFMGKSIDITKLKFADYPRSKNDDMFYLLYNGKSKHNKLLHVEVVGSKKYYYITDACVYFNDWHDEFFVLSVTSEKEISFNRENIKHVPLYFREPTMRRNSGCRDWGN